MSATMRGAWAAEAHVAEKLATPGYLVVPLAPSWPCDLLVVMDGGSAFERKLLWIEVKSARTLARLRANRPTADEEKFLRKRKGEGDMTAVAYVLRCGTTRAPTFRIYWGRETIPSKRRAKK